MNRLTYLWICLVLALLLAGCSDGPSLQDALSDSEITVTTATPTEAPTETPTEAPTEAVTEPAGFQPYLETVYLADLPIFSGPSYDDRYVGTVEEAGVYTVVEEAWDWEGNLWGRLRSGAGWINLTDSRLAGEEKVPVSVSIATAGLLAGSHETCVVDEGEYAVKIALRFYEDVTDICVSFLEFDGETFVVSDSACMFPELTAGKPLVLHLGFPGDLTCYGLAFRDSSGESHRYTISLSGRNGLAVLTEEP